MKADQLQEKQKRNCKMPHAPVRGAVPEASLWPPKASSQLLFGHLVIMFSPTFEKELKGSYSEERFVFTKSAWWTLLTSHFSPYLTEGKNNLFLDWNRNKWPWHMFLFIIHLSDPACHQPCAASSPPGSVPSGGQPRSPAAYPWTEVTRQLAVTSGPSCCLKSRFTKYKTNIVISVWTSWIFFQLIANLKEEWLSPQVTPYIEKLLSY